ncbi:hypothetical protein FNV43_RR13474 [Rhamnella rubrinervis]|uniref:Uncharacterized protein n=1 Tax=Rhamnella rubrinervis TaxID=2594499 RepID=A0A8K0H175_9ROSA|nr:hypothetical protein FNV43_RR13474 [Rhamnella rubrinervis]
MVNFSCFNGHTHSHKHRKTVQPSAEAMHKRLQDFSQIHALKNSHNQESPLLLNVKCDAQVNDNKLASSIDRGWKSQEMKSKFIVYGDLEVTKAGNLKKSQSLGSGLNLEERVFADNDTEDETDQGLSYDSSHHYNRFVLKDGSKNRGLIPSDQHQKVPLLDSPQVSCEIVHNESIFSIGNPPKSEKGGLENSDGPLSDEFAGESGDHTPRIAHVIRSHSLSNLVSYTPVSGHLTRLAPHSRSFEDIHVLDSMHKAISIQEVEKQLMQEQVIDDNIGKAEKKIIENSVGDGYDSCNYSGLTKDWIMPVLEENNAVKKPHEQSSDHHWDELPNMDFKIKRIEEWVNELQNCSPLEETNDSSQSSVQFRKDSSFLNGFAAGKMEDKIIPGVEAAKRYISSLSAVATTAQLANHGLVVIPFLSAFVSLRVLNLSGNAIVRITAGALPRGLHMLNLSKNNISTIDGLRELTRLRILDLSYNRIVRIGHGLAYCSSLKELYLAGNKISEVEGLHRLLKLNLVDLRFNKVSTAKCLGQLAANYNSLQAISLEGNPAQKNVGDDQLKKYLQGLLPHLAYFNRQPIKASTLKDSADRSVRLGTSSLQFDHGSRPDFKSSRKGSHAVATQRPSSSTASYGGRGGQALQSPKRSRGRDGRLPPTGTKATTQNRNQFYDIGSKILNLRADLAMRRSRSEGTLGAF